MPDKIIIPPGNLVNNKINSVFQKNRINVTNNQAEINTLNIRNTVRMKDSVAKLITQQIQGPPGRDGDISSTNQNGLTFIYDSNGLVERIGKSIDPDTTFIYDSNGYINLISSNGVSRQCSYDSEGVLISITYI